MNKLSKAMMEVLGVEVGQRFGFNKDYTDLYFDEDGQLINANDTFFDCSLNDFISDCKNFPLIIEELPWKPKHDEDYYVADVANGDYYRFTVWDNDVIDRRYFKRGLAFKTREEAIAKAKEMLGMK